MSRSSSAALLLGILLAVRSTPAQTPLVIYNDSLVNGFQDWSWSEIHNFASTGTAHSGNNAIGVYAMNWQGVSFYHAAYDTSPYTNLVFWAHGGPLGGQRLQIYCDFASGPGSTPFVLPAALTANHWTQVTIPLATIGAANRTNLTRINLQLTPSGTTNFYYLDDVQLTGNPAPSPITLAINAAQSVRTVDSRLFGVNAAVWDDNFDMPQSVALLAEIGTRIVRLPGGSLSDEYHWMSNTTLSNSWQWATSFANFVHVITNASVNAQAIITVNYGTGTTNEAASWVRHANVTNHFNFKYWEIGNENYGTWETDTNVFPHDGYTYAVRAAKFFAVMKGADPTIKIGIPVVTGENTYVNGYTNHPIYNARTGQTNYGWTPVVLATLKSLGVQPDFLVHHVYPEYGSDSDATLLQAAANWPLDAADLRQQITDYFGSGGTNIELLCTENNANSGNQGRQSTSVVNGLYYADSLGTLMKTEFNAFVWWDFRNGTDNTGDFNSLLYGWRTYGDLGMVNGPGTRHPVFYAAKLMSYFARPGDAVLNAASSYPLLTPYAIRHANGAVSVLALNKTYLTNLTGQLAFAGFTPGANATVYSYGIAQDEAARTNAAYALQDIATNNFSGAGTNFTYSFPPYSLTVLNLIPAAPGIAVTPAAGQMVLQVQGQPNVRYVVQSSTNFTSWTSVATNTLVGTTWNVTNNLSSPWKFWRAVWLP
jgi:hypothetical protein